MRTVFTLLAATTLTLTIAHHDALACTTAQTVQAATYRAVLNNAAEKDKYVEAEAAYAKLAALPNTCTRKEDHRLGATVARSHGDITGAILRYNLAGDEATIKQLNQTYGHVKINASTMPSPRIITWPGFRDPVTTEGRKVFNRANAGFGADGTYRGYMPPGPYILSAGYGAQHVEVRFEVKIGETATVNYP